MKNESVDPTQAAGHSRLLTGSLIAILLFIISVSSVTGAWAQTRRSIPAADGLILRRFSFSLNTRSVAACERRTSPERTAAATDDYSVVHGPVRACRHCSETPFLDLKGM